LSHPTLRIIAFSPARVNGGICILPLQASANGEIVGSIEMMRAAAESILAATGPSPAPLPKIRKAYTLQRSKLNAATLAKYQGIAAQVESGAATWTEACAAAGVNRSTVYQWHFRQQAKARAAAAKRKVMPLP
jgi:hypothetical protein